MWYRLMITGILALGLMGIPAGCSKDDSGAADSTTPVSQRRSTEETAKQDDAPADTPASESETEADEKEGADARALNDDAAGAPPTASAAEEPAGDGPKVRLQTTHGSIVLQLYPDKAPKTVANFLNYVDKGFYDGLIFHRIIPTFMIQGGGFTPEGEQKREGLDDPIENEADNGLKNRKGTIAMARTNDPHSATAQFFINVVDNPFLDYGQAQDGWGYTVFGKVIEGMDVATEIKDVPTEVDPLSGAKSKPIDPPIIEKAERVKEENGK